jgi:hypothetical protein
VDRPGIPAFAYLFAINDYSRATILLQTRTMPLGAYRDIEALLAALEWRGGQHRSVVLGRNDQSKFRHFALGRSVISHVAFMKDSLPTVQKPSNSKAMMCKTLSRHFPDGRCASRTSRGWLRSGCRHSHLSLYFPQ